MELETVAREGARILAVVADNRAWNIERADQLENYGGEVLGTELSSCDFGMLARALGVSGEKVKRAADFDAALARVLDEMPAVVDVKVSRERRSADTKSGLAVVPPATPRAPGTATSAPGSRKRARKLIRRACLGGQQV
ncbi:MAG: thiamine pyrophosphate-dependent enzyme [Solirubrobacterales bacterium]